MKKHSNSAKESELRAKRVKSRGPNGCIPVSTESTTRSSVQRTFQGSGANGEFLIRIQCYLGSLVRDE